jgi:hypothetical protein
VKTRIFGRASLLNILLTLDLALSAPQRQAASLKNKGVEGEQTIFRQEWRIMRFYVFSKNLFKKKDLR